MANLKKLTYETFGALAVKVANGYTMGAEERAAFIEKAEQLVAREARRSSKTKASTAKPETMENAERIGSILDTEVFMTTADINEVLGTQMSGIEVSNAIKVLSRTVDVETTKVKVKVSTGTDENGNDIMRSRDYTAYRLAKPSLEIVD